MLWDSTIHWPVRRCHHRSGSTALRAVMASRPKRRIAAKGISLPCSVWRIRRIVGADYRMAADVGGLGGQYRAINLYQ